MSSKRVLGNIGTGDRWKKYDLIGKTKLWFAISAIAMGIGVFSLATRGLNEGIDFTGGSKIEFTTPAAHSTDEVSSIVSDTGVKEPQVVGTGRSRERRLQGLPDPVEVAPAEGAVGHPGRHRDQARRPA